MPAMTETYVIVHRTHDAVQADMLGDLLRENGIAARVLGTRHGAVIGVGQNILQVHIEVPQGQAGEATDFIEAFLQGQGAEDMDEDEDDQADQAEPARTSEPRPLFAAGMSLMLGAIGGGHFYSRRPWTACVLFAGQLVAITAIMSTFSPAWEAVARSLVMFFGVVALDLGGSQLAVRAHARGVRRSPARQLVTGAMLLAVAGAASAIIGPRLPEPERSRSRFEAPYQLSTP